MVNARKAFFFFLLPVAVESQSLECLLVLFPRGSWVIMLQYRGVTNYLVSEGHSLSKQVVKVGKLSCNKTEHLGWRLVGHNPLVNGAFRLISTATCYRMLLSMSLLW